MPLMKGGLVSMTTKGCVQKQTQTNMYVNIHSSECGMSHTEHVPAYQWPFRHVLCAVSATSRADCWLYHNATVPILQCSTIVCCANQWSNVSSASIQSPSLSPRTTNEIPIFLKFPSFTGNTPDKYSLSGNTSLKSRVLKVILSSKYIWTR